MAQSNNENDLRRANLRLCRLCVWPNYGGLGFNLENTSPPPHVIRTVESNSPAAAGGLKILDLVLAVNNEDVSGADYKTVTNAIKSARDSNARIELLVIEKRFYEPFKSRGIVFTPAAAKIMEAPPTMPRDFMNFPKYTPRTCEISLSKIDTSFGFEVINGHKDIGAFIQEVVPNSPAGRSALRKSDRILEIDDKFVDNELSKNIIDKLFKAKKKQAVKLYVVDTYTYKHFQDNAIPLASKDFRKSKFAREIQFSPYINVEDISTEPKSAGVDIPPPSFPISSIRDTQLSTISENVNIRGSHQDDIRLCTIVRANATDQYGIELNYQKREQYHSMKLASSRNNQPPNAALAGVKSDDHLIEVNGENIENLDGEELKQRIYAIKYPQPLQILVADSATYNYYKQQNKLIHSGLPSVQKLPQNIIDRSSTLTTSHREPSITVPSTITSLPADEPSLGVTGLVNSTAMQPRISMPSTDYNRRQYRLQHIPGFRGYGFSVNSNQTGSIAHKITQIAPGSPAALQGLRVGDYISTINDQNVEKMNAIDFNVFLRTSAENAETRGHPLLIQVINENTYQNSTLSNDVPARHSTSNNLPSITTLNNENPNRLSQKIPRNESHKSTTSQLAISRNGSRTLPSSQLPIPQNGSHKLRTTQLISNPPYTSVYDSPPQDRYSQPDIEPSKTLSPSSYRSHGHLSRGAVDVVSENRLLRYCRLTTEPGQAFGFQLKPDDPQHNIYNIQPNSPAARAGLSENDRLFAVDDENVENKPSKEVAALIRNAVHKGVLHLFIAPNSIKTLSKRSAKSLPALDDNRYYRDTTSRSKYDNRKQLSSSTGRSRSVARLFDDQNPSSTTNNISSYSSEPIEPLPRKCVLQHDPLFRGCGFRLTERPNFDTPIITEVCSDSPAKRSGLTEGDHIIYIDSQNVQSIKLFDDITYLIQRKFEENGQVTLVTLTGPGYQVLKRRGGYLDNTVFDYQSSSIDQLKPRLCKLKLYNHEHDFGFSLQPHNLLSVKYIEQGSSADASGLRKGDIVLELNGKIAKYLSINQIKEITEKSKQERKLDILVIDIEGYQFSMRHAIPLNSLLSFVQTREGQAAMMSNRLQHEAVYL